MVKSERDVIEDILLEAPKHDVTLFRNNSGAFKDATGRMVRFGLGNVSKNVNAQIKSADLIGWQEVTITRDMVGQRIARFVSVEVKKEKWKLGENKEREVAQGNWLALVAMSGGVALMINNVKEFIDTFKIKER